MTEGDLPEMDGAGQAPVASVRDLSIGFRTHGRWLDVVRRISFDIGRGEILGLVGESGSGKSVTSLALLGLVPTIGGRITEGRIDLDGVDVTDLSDRRWTKVRGSTVAMVFQNPVLSLDPAFTVGDQIVESIRAHHRMTRRRAWSRAIELLDSVHIAEASRRAHDYPHALSGGMCQRVMIAIALASDPQLLVADEPTTALDVTVQAKFLELLREIRQERGLSILFITHDLAVVSEISDRVAVMYAGTLVEIAPVGELFARPRHPYTEGLLASISREAKGRRMVAIPGHIPTPDRLPTGCTFHPRCRYAVNGTCTEEEPAPIHFAHDHTARCARANTLELKGLDDGVA